jgi:hypothetical protein
MSLYPNILDISAFNIMLAQHQQPQISHLPPSPSKSAHQQQLHHQITPNHVSEAFLDFLSHMFAPASYLACTCSTPCWAPAPASSDANVARHDEKLKIVVDDDIVVIEDEREEDGGPLCREATIASWKVGGKKERRNSSRRRSLQWLAGVIGREA